MSVQEQSPRAVPNYLIKNIIIIKVFEKKIKRIFFETFFFKEISYKT